MSDCRFLMIELVINKSEIKSQSSSLTIFTVFNTKTTKILIESTNPKIQTEAHPVLEKTEQSKQERDQIVQIIVDKKTHKT